MSDNDSMKSYTIFVRGEAVMSGLHATSKEGALDRCFYLQGGRISKEKMQAVEEIPVKEGRP